MRRAVETCSDGGSSSSAIRRSRRRSGPCISGLGMNRWPHGIGRVNRHRAPAGSGLRGCWRRLNIWPTTYTRLQSGLSPASKARHRPAPRARRSIQPFRTGPTSLRLNRMDLPCSMLLAAGALGLGATLTTLYLQFEKEAEAALGLPPSVLSYALLPIGYPMGRFGPVRRVPLADLVYGDRWGQAYRDL